MQGAVTRLPDSTYRTAIGTAVIAGAATAYFAARAGKPHEVIDAEAEAAYRAALAEHGISESQVKDFLKSNSNLRDRDLPRHQRQPRRPSIRKMIEQAEKAGMALASVTMPDGTTLNFGKPESAPENPWLADLHKVKQ